jgi:hypothetical protein
MGFTERLDLPDGQWAELLTRLPYDRQMAVEVATERDAAITGALADKLAPETAIRGATWAGWVDAVMRAVLWQAHLRGYLEPDKWLDAAEVGQADPQVTDKIRLHAVKLYLEWRKAIDPGPKESSQSGTQTPDNQTPTGSNRDSSTEPQTPTTSPPSGMNGKSPSSDLSLAAP